MTGYVIRRLVVAVVVTFGIALITFALLHFLSPSPVYDVLGAKAQPAAVIATAWKPQQRLHRTSRRLDTRARQAPHDRRGRRRPPTRWVRLGDRDD